MIELYEGSVLGSQAKIIAHQVNCRGVMGAGLALQIRNQFPQVYDKYRACCLKACHPAKNQDTPEENLLGNILFVSIGPGREGGQEQYIANLFAQRDFGRNRCMTDYIALEKCLCKLHAIGASTRIAIPDHIGCGLAGGDWDNVVFPMINNIFGHGKMTLEIWKFDKQ